MCGLLLGLLGAILVRLLPAEQGPETLTDGTTLLWMIVLACLLAAVSFLDDRRGLPVWGRFAAHVIAASLFVICGQMSLVNLSLPLAGSWELGPLSIVCSILFLVWMMNLYNFMDGMDGFAAGMTVIGGLWLAVVGGATNHWLLLVLPALLAGSSAGFLVRNFPPARIFMGDVGSVPIGFLFGALILWGSHDGVFELWVPLTIFSPFIVDATVTLFRRLLRGERVWEAHRSHYYQRLVLAGWSHRKTVFFEYGLMMVCGALAMSYHFGSDGQRAGVLLVVAMVYLALIGMVPSIERRAVS